MIPSPRSTPLHPRQVLISRSEYDRLVLLAAKYGKYCLCQNLIRGGVDTATLELLSESHSVKNDHDASESKHAYSTPASTVVEYRGRPFCGPKDNSYAVQQLQHESDSESEASPGSLLSNDQSSLDPDDSASVVPGRLSYEQAATRTVQLNNLPPKTTHSELVAVVRGGPVVDIYINFKEHRAAVSFVYGEHAKKYFELAQTVGIYIHDSPVSVSWSHRQFILAPYVAQQLRGGASRNLIIRYYDKRITADSIRQDLEHIHNLVVVSVEFSRLDCYISTNSVTAASFARTCMMSRYPYRGSRIEWAADDCAQSLDQLKRKKKAPLTAAHPSASLNRFSLLNIE